MSCSAARTAVAASSHLASRSLALASYSSAMASSALFTTAARKLPAASSPRRPMSWWWSSGGTASWAGAAVVTAAWCCWVSEARALSVARWWCASEARALLAARWWRASDARALSAAGWCCASEARALSAVGWRCAPEAMASRTSPASALASSMGTLSSLDMQMQRVGLRWVGWICTFCSTTAYSTSSVDGLLNSAHFFCKAFFISFLLQAFFIIPSSCTNIFSRTILSTVIVQGDIMLDECCQHEVSVG
ncbi:unnamed protein product [Triticum turgidum subsp. durum]|uniref:Uncharacterized protein n=1 Tax=Triticum turgidum subsp. durum TaxID=4567 RepID=A0A9R1NWN4_TRITD|nr:unnamed protein product [Triticum turgidum subsp. durum]